MKKGERKRTGEIEKGGVKEIKGELGEERVGKQVLREEHGKLNCPTF